MKNQIIKLAIVLLLMLSITGCSSKMVKYSSGALGATGGAMVGGMLGMLAAGGGNSKNSNIIIPAGVILGAIAGATSGSELGSAVSSKK